MSWASTRPVWALFRENPLLEGITPPSSPIHFPIELGETPNLRAAADTPPRPLSLFTLITY